MYKSAPPKIDDVLQTKCIVSIRLFIKKALDPSAGALAGMIGTRHMKVARHYHHTPLPEIPDPTKEIFAVLTCSTLSCIFALFHKML